MANQSFLLCAEVMGLPSDTEPAAVTRYCRVSREVCIFSWRPWHTHPLLGSFAQVTAPPELYSSPALLFDTLTSPFTSLPVLPSRPSLAGLSV